MKIAITFLILMVGIVVIGFMHTIMHLVCLLLGTSPQELEFEKCVLSRDPRIPHTRHSVVVKLKIIEFIGKLPKLMSILISWLLPNRLLSIPDVVEEVDDFIKATHMVNEPTSILVLDSGGLMFIELSVKVAKGQRKHITFLYTKDGLCLVYLPLLDISKIPGHRSFKHSGSLKYLEVVIKASLIKVTQNNIQMSQTLMFVSPVFFFLHDAYFRPKLDEYAMSMGSICVDEKTYNVIVTQHGTFHAKTLIWLDFKQKPKTGISGETLIDFEGLVVLEAGNNRCVRGHAEWIEKNGLPMLNKEDLVSGNTPMSIILENSVVVYDIFDNVLNTTIP